MGDGFDAQYQQYCANHLDGRSRPFGELHLVFPNQKIASSIMPDLTSKTKKFFVCTKLQPTELPETAPAELARLV
jgi:hypothetical protein